MPTREELQQQLAQNPIASKLASTNFSEQLCWTFMGALARSFWYSFAARQKFNAGLIAFLLFCVISWISNSFPRYQHRALDFIIGFYGAGVLRFSVSIHL